MAGQDEMIKSNSFLFCSVSTSDHFGSTKNLCPFSPKSSQQTERNKRRVYIASTPVKVQSSGKTLVRASQRGHTGWTHQLAPCVYTVETWPWMSNTFKLILPKHFSFLLKNIEKYNSLQSTIYFVLSLISATLSLILKTF